MMSSIVGSDSIKIHQFYESLFDNIGSTIMLPCKTTDPKAEVYWINESGKVISGQEPRYLKQAVAVSNSFLTNFFPTDTRFSETAIWWSTTFNSRTWELTSAWPRTPSRKPSPAPSCTPLPRESKKLRISPHSYWKTTAPLSQRHFTQKFINCNRQVLEQLLNFINPFTNRLP